MAQRLNLESLVEPEKPRQTIDATWSKGKKTLVAVLACVGGLTAISFGFWKAWSMTAPGLPTTAAQAVAVINSARFDNLDEARKEQYVEETHRLIRAMPENERRALRDDPRFRDAMMRMREEQMDENARRFARGQELENMGFGGRGGGQPTEEQRKEWEKMRKEWEEREAKMTAEEKAKQEEERQRRQEEMRKRMNERMGSAINTGSAQNMGLRTEMFKRMARQGGGRGFGPGGGRGPGGGGRGPGGGGGPR